MILDGSSRAADIMKWAWEDPPGRVQQAIEQVDELARSATGLELAEIQSAGTMLSRLASSIRPDTPIALAQIGDLLVTQLADGGGVIGQLLDLTSTKAHDTASATARATWRRDELRDRHGRWSSGTGDATGDALSSRYARQARIDADRKARLQAAEQALAEQQKTQASEVSTPIGPPSSENKAAGIAAQVLAGLPTYKNPASDAIHKKLAEQADLAATKAAAAQTRADAAMDAGERAIAAAQTKADEAIARLQAQMKTDEATQAAKDAADDAHQAKVRLALHIASISIGGIIAGLVTALSAGLSLPVAAAIGAGAGISGNVIQELIDWAKKL